MFNIGGKYDGKTFTIHHEKESGDSEEYTAICKDGMVSITVDDALSLPYHHRVANGAALSMMSHRQAIAAMLLLWRYSLPCIAVMTIMMGAAGFKKSRRFN